MEFAWLALSQAWQWSVADMVVSVMRILNIAAWANFLRNYALLAGFSMGLFA